MVRPQREDSEHVVPLDGPVQQADAPAGEAMVAPRAPGLPLPSQRVAKTAMARVAGDAAQPVSFPPRTTLSVLGLLCMCLHGPSHCGPSEEAGHTIPSQHVTFV